ARGANRKAAILPRRRLTADSSVLHVSSWGRPGDLMGRRLFFVGLAAGIAIAVAASARAQLLPGNFYVGAEGGWTRLLTVLNKGHPGDTGPFVGQDAVSSESFNSGFNVGGRAGFQSG